MNPAEDQQTPAKQCPVPGTGTAATARGIPVTGDSARETPGTAPAPSEIPPGKPKLRKIPFRETRDLLLAHVTPVATETAPLESLLNRILAEDIHARIMVPHYDRSPLDGYALMSADTQSATPESPVTLHVAGEIKAGDTADITPAPGEAVKILTGAPVPRGADAVIRYEDTVFTPDTVTISHPLRPGENIIYAGEDVKIGDVLMTRGTRADLAELGMLASQGFDRALVFQKPRVALICTGSELTEPGTELQGSQIYNSARPMLMAALEKDGCQADYLGCAADDLAKITALIRSALEDHDAVLLTGGVSAGDYDLVPSAMEQAGISLMIRGVRMKPGMAFACGVSRGRPCIGLSGNPAAAMVSYHCIAAPLLRKCAGAAVCVPPILRVLMTGDFGKTSRCERILRGPMSFEDGRLAMCPSDRQGNVMISGLKGADLLVIVPEGHGPVKKGDVLEGFLI